MKTTKFIYIIAFISLGILFSRCTSPLDVQANRIIVNPQETQTGDGIFSLSTIAPFYFNEPNEIQYKKFTITNLLNQNYTIDSIKLLHQVDCFSLGYVSLPMILAPNSSIQNNNLPIIVTVNPTKPGTYIDTIQINGLAGPYAIVQAEVFTIYVPNLPFDAVPVNTSVTNTLTIKNYSDTTIVIKSKTMNDPDSVFTFEQDITFPYYVVKGKSFSATITFTPRESGKTYNGSISFDIQSTGQIQNTCQLSGVGM